MVQAKGLNVGIGLSLRPYDGDGGGGSDPDFQEVTVLYGFEDANFSTGVHNDGSLADGSVQNNGVVPSGAFFVAGAQSAAFNQNGALSNDGITMGGTINVIGSGDFTIEGWIRDPGSAGFLLFSCGVDNNSSNRLNLDFRADEGVNCVFGGATVRTSPASVWPVNQFFHFAFVFETTPAFRCYVDGQQVLSGTDTFTRAGNAHLGRHIVLSQPVSGPQYLDEMRITKVARYSGASFPVPSVPFPRS